jgi:hypothetical protein
MGDVYLPDAVVRKLRRYRSYKEGRRVWVALGQWYVRGVAADVRVRDPHPSS